MHFDHSFTWQWRHENVNIKIKIPLLSGFYHFGLVLFVVLWQSPDTPGVSWFHVSARLRVCSSRALSHLRALFRVGAWCSDPSTHVLSFGFESGFGHSRSTFCLFVSVSSLACLTVCFSPTGMFLFVLFIIINKKTVFPPAIGSSLSSLPPNLTVIVSTVNVFTDPCKQGSFWLHFSLCANKAKETRFCF